MPGFDTHDDQHARHSMLLREFSLSLLHFQQAIDALGMEDKVTLFTQSDFGRTLTPNNSGADHAWGGNQLVLGAATTGHLVSSDGDLAPDMSEQSVQMIDGHRGRIIPALAHEQALASLLDLTEKELPEILPRYQNFGGRMAF